MNTVPQGSDQPAISMTSWPALPALEQARNVPPDLMATELSWLPSSDDKPGEAEAHRAFGPNRTQPERTRRIAAALEAIGSLT